LTTTLTSSLTLNVCFFKIPWFTQKWKSGGSQHNLFEYRICSGSRPGLDSGLLLYGIGFSGRDDVCDNTSPNSEYSSETPGTED